MHEGQEVGGLKQLEAETPPVACRHHPANQNRVPEDANCLVRESSSRLRPGDIVQHVGEEKSCHAKSVTFWKQSQ